MTPQREWRNGSRPRSHLTEPQAHRRLQSEPPPITIGGGFVLFGRATGITAAARAAGRRVPEDHAVVGCDDTAVAAVWDPPLTTIRLR